MFIGRTAAGPRVRGCRSRAAPIRGLKVRPYPCESRPRVVRADGRNVGTRVPSVLAGLLLTDHHRDAGSRAGSCCLAQAWGVLLLELAGWAAGRFWLVGYGGGHFASALSRAGLLSGLVSLDRLACFWHTCASE